MKNADTNAVVLRKVGAYLKDSVFSQLEWAIEKLGVSDMWDIKASVPEMVYKKTGQKILFRGADKVQKLKSTKVTHGYIRYICLDRTAVRPRTGLPSDGRFRFFIE